MTLAFSSATRERPSPRKMTLYALTLGFESVRLGSFEPKVSALFTTSLAGETRAGASFPMTRIVCPFWTPWAKPGRRPAKRLEMLKRQLLKTGGQNA